MLCRVVEVVIVGRVKGYTAERELVIKLWKLGFAVMRSPASGSKIRKAKYPDVVAIKSGKVLVFEVKSRSKAENIYLRSEQVEKLREFTERSGGQAYIVIKLSGSDWRVIELECLEKMPNGNYRLSKELIMKSKTLDELLRNLRLIPSLEDFIKRSTYEGG